MSSPITLLICSFLVSSFLTKVTQHIHSLRASGVRSSHISNAALSEVRAFRKSVGSLCTTPGEIVLLIIVFYQTGVFRTQVPGTPNLHPKKEERLYFLSDLKRPTACVRKAPWKGTRCWAGCDLPEPLGVKKATIIESPAWTHSSGDKFFDNFYAPGFVFVTLNAMVVLKEVVSSTVVLSSFTLSVSIFSNSLSPFPRRIDMTSIFNSSHSPELRHC